ncbi:hypothetical protein [Streptomyces sp. NRRL S-455]|uniref:hypothetical protein n=1 Tax=Streptomyces sp. NRRL S-455 TaxID=1463908 RepID=UPI000ADA9A5C|nr:hypothetical protein [Streptomyces sp. NRRL S-455]
MRLRLLLAALCESLLLALVRLLLPAQGRHRAATDRGLPLPLPEHPPATAPAPTHRRLHTEPFEMDTPLVRPYLHALEVHA